MTTGTGRRVALAGALAALLAAPAAAIARDPLEARVDRTELALGEKLTLEITLEAGASPTSWELPSTPDFEVVFEGRFQESKGTLGGGGVRIVETQTIVRELRPTRAGTLTIPPVSAVVQGKRHVTQPIVVRVSAAPPRERAPAAGAPGPGGGTKGRIDPSPTPRERGGWAYGNWKRDVALRVEVSARELWVGEQLTATTWLSVPYRIVDFEWTKLPAYDGFWRESLDPRTLRSESRGTQLAYLLTRSALFPTRAGALTIEPFEGTPDIVVRGGGVSVFGEIVRVPARSAPVTVQVRPLPPDAPPGFDAGNVGALSLEVTAAPERVTAGEPVTIRIAIAGDGNVRAIAPPRLPALPGARAYEPVTTDRVEERGGRLHGTRLVETTVVPERAGTLSIPALEWPYFDPRSGKYQVAITPAIRVEVEPPGAATREPPPAAADPAARLRPLRADGALRRAGPPAWRRPWFLGLLLAPPLAFLAVAAAAARRDRGGAGARASAGAGRDGRRRLLAARRKRAGDPAGAAAEVERALLAYATGRLGRPAAGLTREALALALARAGAHGPAVEALIHALALVDAARYGAGDVHAEEILTAAERALAALDEADWTREVGA